MLHSEIKAVSIKLDPHLHERLKGLAQARQRNPQFLITEAIQQYMEREKKRETLRQDALQAWNDYQTTGLHITHEEADVWLAQLEAGEIVEPPACHSRK